MQRRKFITAASALGVTAVAGCLGSGSSGSGTTKEDLDVEVEFTMDGDDLVAKHTGGDVLSSGQTVLLTVAGDQVAKATLSEDVRVGGEIIRAENVGKEDKYFGSNLIGLYAEQGGSEVELASTEFRIRDNVPTAPNAQLNFDYDAKNERLQVYHDGGYSINTSNTEKLTFANDSSESMSFASDQSSLDPDGTVTGSIQAGDIIGDSGAGNFAADDTVELVWVAPNGEGSATIGTFEGPSA